MKLLCLCKRRPQGRDLLTDPYGRFFHLPRLMATRGHEVHLLVLDYQRTDKVYRYHDSLHWHSVSALPWGPGTYLTSASRLVRSFQPDWIIGLSDTWYGILAQRLAANHGSRSLIDAYDNYESYLPWAYPLHRRWRQALQRAHAVTAAGPQLAALMSATAGDRHVHTIPMAADPEFIRLPMDECRRELGLPTSNPLLGYTGSLHATRGIELLIDVYTQLRNQISGLEMVISGRQQMHIRLPEGVHALGYRPADQVPLIMNSLNALMVLNKPGAFGDYSYPAKLYEAMACGIPVIASNVVGTAWILRQHPELLATAGDALDFTNKAERALAIGRINYKNTGNWDESAERLHAVLLT